VLGLREVGTGGTRARLLGTAAHGVLEAIDLAASAPEEIDHHLAARPEALALRTRELVALAADLRAAAAALRREVAAGLVVSGREVPFVLPLPVRGPTIFVHGRLDLLADRGATRVVRDYKYATASDAAVENHGAQLGAYRLAVHAAGADDVAAELVFLRGGPTVRPLPPIDLAAEEAALVRAGTALAEALGSGTIDAFPRGPTAAAMCTRLGCGYVRRCWGLPLTRTATSPTSRSAAS
jgi:hypothetical protein